MNYCPNCGNPTQEHDEFCNVCGQKLTPSVDYGTPAPKVSSSDAIPPAQPYSPDVPQTPSMSQQQYYQPQANVGRYQQAPLGDRCGAYFIDGFITQIGIYLCFVGCIYSCFKDGMNEGRSFGKNILNVRVINYNTGLPATYSESCVRNCCNLCVCYLLIDKDQRHIGDHIAGTIVIRD